MRIGVLEPSEAVVVRHIQSPACVVSTGTARDTLESL